MGYSFRRCREAFAVLVVSVVPGGYKVSRPVYTCYNGVVARPPDHRVVGNPDPKAGLAPVASPALSLG